MEFLDIETCTWPGHSINNEVFTSDTCDVVPIECSNFIEFVALKAFKILVLSWESWNSDPHSSQRVWSFGMEMVIDDRSWELFDEPKEISDDMPVVVWLGGERLFIGDIQDWMMEGNTSRENPLYPHKEIYPMLFDLTTEKGTFVIAVLSAIRVVKDSICSKSSSNLSSIKHPDRMRVFRDFSV